MRALFISIGGFFAVAGACAILNPKPMVLLGNGTWKKASSVQVFSPHGVALFGWLAIGFGVIVAICGLWWIPPPKKKDVRDLPR